MGVGLARVGASPCSIGICSRRKLLINGAIGVMALPADQRFGCGGNVGHQLRRCLQVPVSMGDIRVAQVCRQGHE